MYMLCYAVWKRDLAHYRGRFYQTREEWFWNG